MDKQKSLRISFCTTCKNRGHHLAETLPKNLEATKDYPNAEFVILDYGDDNGIEGKTIKEWLIEKFPEEIASGRIRYARTEQEHFKMAHAKNMAHRLGTGDVLVNLDADNVMGAGFAKWLDKKFDEDKKFAYCSDRDKFKEKILHKNSLEGVSGRIAISSDTFHQMHGYDEHLNAWGGDDTNMIARAHQSQVEFVAIPPKYWGNVISHNLQSRIDNLAELDKQKSITNLTKREGISYQIHCLLRAANVAKKAPQNGANPDGYFGCGNVTLLNHDFSETRRNLEPQPHPKWQEKPSPNMGEKFWSRQMDAELNSGYHSRG